MMEREPLALVFVPDEALRRVLIELLHDCGFRTQSAMQRDDIVSTTRTLAVAVLVAEGWALGLRLEQIERDEIEALAAMAPLMLVGAGAWANETSAEELGAVCILREPFDIDEFDTQLRRCLDRSVAPSPQPRGVTPKA